MIMKRTTTSKHLAGRRQFLLTGLAGAGTTMLALAGCAREDAATANAMLATAQAIAQKTPALSLEVWKTPNCGCCKLWVAHLEKNGFAVQAHNVNDTSAMRAQLGMPSALGSCHTAQVAGYVIEGHVPASEIKRLLAEKPQALGLSVPGMPIGSPGMEVGDQKPEYDVLLVLADGSTRVFHSYRA
jgi:hypothetical protein